MRRILYFFIVFFCLSLLVSAGAGVWAWNWLNQPLDNFDQQKSIHIERGSNLYTVADRLHRRGLIHHPKIWVWYARSVGLTAVKAGEYDLSRAATPLAILKLVNSGNVLQYSLTLIEGKRFSDFVETIQQSKKIAQTFEADSALQALADAGIELEHPEGWFYPDTYQYSAGDTDISILTRAYEKMKFTLNEEWDKRSENLPYKNAYEALIMASIIEKETGVPKERGEIAGVFVRRLQKGMRLQTDPTVIYGMGDQYQGNIRRKDLSTPTPYNTYVIKGLPPTPIANPATAAIHAALHPEPGNSLYFVAKGDGSHYFSSTLEEHNDAVTRFQKRRVDNYRSSPATPMPASENNDLESELSGEN